MNTLFFAKIIGPTLCFIGANLSVNKNIINAYIQDVLDASTGQIASSLTLLLLGASLTAAFIFEQDAFLALGLAGTFLLGGTLKLLFSECYRSIINYFSPTRYVNLIGYFFLVYGIALLYYAF